MKFRLTCEWLETRENPAVFPSDPIVVPPPPPPPTTVEQPPPTTVEEIPPAINDPVW